MALTRRRRASKSTLAVTVHLPPTLEAEAARVAKRTGTSRSRALVALIEEGLRGSVEHQHGSLIEAAVERVVREQLDRLVSVATRAAVDAHTSRRLLPQVLLRQGLPREQVRTIVLAAEADAWRALRSIDTALAEPQAAAEDAA